LPAGRDFTGHVDPPVPVGVGDGDVVGDVDGDGEGDVVRLGEGDGDGEVVRLADGDGEADVLPEAQTPRSIQSAGVATGFQPAPTGGVFAICAW
jgi:hypothetical protein